MNTPQKEPDPNTFVRRAVDHLRRAELNLVEAVRPGSHPDNALLLEVHALVRDAFSALSRTVHPQQEK